MSMNSKGVVNTSSEKLKNVEMALEALRNVIKNHPGKKLGFCILRIPEASSGIGDSGFIIIRVRIPIRRESLCIGRLWLQLCYQRMFTLHTKGDGIPILK